MSSHVQGVSSSQNHNIQKRSIIEVLHELQRQLQAYGQGPFTPEQAKEVENLKLLYLKAKQQYEKQLKLLQTSMATQPTSIQASPSTGVALPAATTHTIGITSVPNPQQVIKNQQATIIHQLQRSQTTIPNLATTQSVISAHLLSQHNLQIVGSVANIVASSSGNFPMVATAGKGTTINANVNKQQILARAQVQSRPTLSAVNVATHTLPANNANLVQQQQLRMMAIATNQRQDVQGIHQGSIAAKQPTSSSAHTSSVTNSQAVQVLSRRKLQDLLHEIDPRETMDEDVEELLLQIADDFIENVVGCACKLAKHRKSNTLETKDIQLHLDRHWNMWIPGFGNEDLKPHKKVPTVDAHRQRMAIIKKSLKK